MPEKSFAEAFVAAPFTVMGRKLRPFCAYYQFWLETVRSPLWQGKRAANAVDLELASLVCSAKYGTVEELLQNFERRNRWERFRWKLWGQWRWALRALCCKPQRQIDTFNSYLRTYYSPPEFHPVAQPKKFSADFPPILAAVCAMIELSGWDEERVWMLPLGRLHWYVAGYFRNKGIDLKMVTARDRLERELREKIIAGAERKAGRKLTLPEREAAYMEWVAARLRARKAGETKSAS
ncbi:MAG: hypothetical protein LBH01_02055 [Verrucomicrobiales bacterium]|jgi:hypothetical protein|nr:hypothetical protein [Verrucomicrobiales bacterium]